MNLRLALFVPFLAAAPALAQQFGEPLALTEPTGITDILADPGAFEGELVQVKGTITDVCPHAGCYVVIRGEGPGQIVFKVEDGAMVFTPDLKGRGITAEGVVAVVPPKPAPKAADGCGGCGEGGEGGDACGACGGCGEGGTKPAPPKPAARLNGVGALVK